MPTGRARVHLVKADRSSGSSTHNSTCNPVTHTHTLVISPSPASSSASSSASLCLWCCSRRLQKEETRHERRNEGGGTSGGTVFLPLREAQMSPLRLSCRGFLCSLLCVSMLTCYDSSPVLSSHALPHSTPLSLSAEAANQARAPDRGFACDEWREDECSASLLCTVCPPPQPRSL